MPTPEPVRRRPRADLVLLGCVAASWVAALAVSPFVPDDDPEGIGGFSPRDSYVLMTLIVGFFWTFWGLLAAQVFLFVAQRRRWLPSAGPVALGAAAYGVGLMVAIPLVVAVLTP